MCACVCSLLPTASRKPRGERVVVYTELPVHREEEEGKERALIVAVESMYNMTVLQLYWGGGMQGDKST